MGCTRGVWGRSSRRYSVNGGATLVIMECCFHENIEIFSNQATVESLSFTVCVQGTLRNVCQGRPDIKIQKNETLFARYKEEPQKMSSIFNAHEENCFITIQLGSEWLKSDPKSLHADVFNNPFWQGIYKSGPVSRLMLTVSQDIINATKEADVQNHYISAKVLELWSHQLKLLERLATVSNQKVVKLNAQDVAVIHQVADILIDEMANPPGLLELSRRVGINDFKLKKGFKQIYGTTVFGFLHTHRMETARALIKDRQCSVSQAAAKVGFKSPSHFSMAFKQVYGVTPRQILDLA
ncbi:helix-turn-helix transcriptional regulator [Veronia pacifica]|uniref:helix-turn-helix transcriptional regulator n=1 Tax=Veronia pacifica TaxID=1080227 RepID=UPI001586648D|nr:AraC family transcriptional regulator [Veronia pacifica]